MTVTVIYQEVIPVFHHIQLIVQSRHKLEVIIRPVQALTITGRKSEHHDRLIRVIGQLIVTIIAITITVTVAITIATVAAIVRIAAITVIRVITITVIAQIITTDIRLFGEVGAHRQCIRSFASEPRIHKRYAVCLIVTSICLAAQRQRLSFTLRNNAFICTRIQQVLHGEVRKLQTQLTDHTSLSPTGRELDLVICLGHKVVLDIHRSVIWIGYWLRNQVFRVEMSHLCYFTG